MARFGFLVVALLVASISMTTAQIDCSQNTDCNTCFNANSGRSEGDDLCVWCNDPITSVTDNCQAIPTGGSPHSNCRNLNYMLPGCTISYLAAIIIVVVGIFLLVCCCCACCVCLIVLCVRASRGKSHVTYTHMS